MTNTHQQLVGRIFRVANRFGWFAIAVVAIAVITASSTLGAVVWDGEHGTQWWFDPQNWNRDSNNNTTLPPGNSATGVTDTQINLGTLNLTGGEGVVYDPVNDPNLPIPGSITFPSGFDAHTIQQLYLSREGQTNVPVPTPNNLLTIKGDLTATGQIVIGRSSGQRDVPTFAQITQKGGVFNVTLSSLDIAQVDTSHNGYGDGTYDYRKGTLNVSRDGGSGLRLSNGSSTAAPDGSPAGAAGIAKLIVHNPGYNPADPTTGGFIRAYDVASAAYSGVADGAVTSADPNGTTKGVSIFEFHYENGGIRPIQVGRNLSINNGIDGSGTTPTMGTRSSRLDIKLDSAPTVTGGIPNNIGLFDVDFDQTDLATGTITGTGDVDGDGIFNDDRVFSNANAVNPLAVSAAYFQDSIVSATFGSTKYNWKISYTGNIVWSDAGNSVVDTISGTGGTDIVLIGLSTESQGVPGDYNNNGVVDAADYVLWRNGGPLQNEVDTPGTVNGADYTAWRARFGNTSGAGAALGAAAVPEPGACLLALGSVIAVAAGRRRP